MIALEVGEAETEAFWREFLQSLVARGLVGVQLAVSDAHPGLRRRSPRSSAAPGNAAPSTSCATWSATPARSRRRCSRRSCGRSSGRRTARLHGPSYQRRWPRSKGVGPWRRSEPAPSLAQSRPPQAEIAGCGLPDDRAPIAAQPPKARGLATADELPIGSKAILAAEPKPLADPLALSPSQRVPALRGPSSTSRFERGLRTHSG